MPLSRSSDASGFQAAGDRPAVEVDSRCDAASRTNRRLSLGPWVVLLSLVFGWGLTRDLYEPWLGMHDWNGALYSQFARNFLRYPFDAHRGMPVIAAGTSLPDVDHRSIYATHPPALVWLVAGSFALIGESEAAARLVPILASLLSLPLFVWIVARAYGHRVALVSAAFYSVMPMSVYFGRMVNHEPVCLACMLAVVAGTIVLSDGAASGRRRVTAWFAWASGMLVGVWTDWPMSLFAGLLMLWFVSEFVRHRRSLSASGRRRMAAMGLAAGLLIAVMLAYLVEFGLDGQWSDLVAVCFSRTGVWSSGALGRDPATAGEPITHTLENLSVPLLALALIGVLMRGLMVLSRRRHAADATTPRVQGPSSDRPRDQVRSARVGLHLICLTGILWIAYFPRQYVLHNYWLFYLGPAAALYAGWGLCGAHAFLQKSGNSLATIACGAILLAVVGTELGGVQDYFGRLAYVAPIEDLELIRERTAPDESLVLFGDHIRFEQRGAYRLRSIIPPQFAYYLDRPFVATRSVSDGLVAASHNLLFVISKADAVRQGRSLESLRRQCLEEPLQHLVVFRARQLGGGHRPSP